MPMGYSRIGPAGGRPVWGRPPDAPLKKQVDGDAFADVLQKEIHGQSPKAGVGFSKHALKKIEQRKISFSNSDMEKIKSAMERLRQKGGKEGLILYGDMGLIVNVNDNKVVTCVDKSHLRENVFVNIDSVAIVE